MYKTVLGYWQKTRKDLIFFTLVCFVLIQNNYFSESEWVLNTLKIDPVIELRNLLNFDVDTRFYELLYWVLNINFYYLFVPIILLKSFGESLSNYGLNFKIEKGAIKLFLICIGIMLPLVVYFSGTESFQNRYPFYKTSSGHWDIWQFSWEFLYITQFFALEFFFRGFMVHYLKKRIGFYSILVMTIPYCMIHFGKPYPETIGAVAAGIVLGTFSYRSGSIWLGFFLHISVALTMDLLAFYA